MTIDFKDYSLWSTVALIDRLDQLQYKLDANPFNTVASQEYNAIVAELDKR